MDIADQEYLLSVQNLTTYFPITEGILSRPIARVHAVENVTFGLASCRAKR